jgi:hypothetical protein
MLWLWLLLLLVHRLLLWLRKWFVSGFSIFEVGKLCIKYRWSWQDGLMSVQFVPRWENCLFNKLSFLRCSLTRTMPCRRGYLPRWFNSRIYCFAVEPRSHDRKAKILSVLRFSTLPTEQIGFQCNQLLDRRSPHGHNDISTGYWCISICNDFFVMVVITYVR